jgi:hypothetical protein
MGEWTIFTIATTVVGEMHTSGRAFRRGIMREIAGFGAVGTGSLGEWPTEGNLIRVMLIRASEASGAAAYIRKRT